MTSLLRFDGQLASFITASVIIIVVPGVDFALITRQVMRHGRTTGFVTLLGLVVGGLTHATLATAGLSALLVASPKLYTILRFAGVAYLVYLGLAVLWSTRSADKSERAQITAAASNHVNGPSSAPVPGPHVRAKPVPEAGDKPLRQANRKAFRMGILSNLLNAKVILFYVTFLPQFVTPGPAATAQTAIHAFMFITLAVIWWICYILLIDSLQRWLTRPRVKVVIERVTGLTLVAFALKIALY